MVAAVVCIVAAGCGPRRAAVVAPVADPGAEAEALEASTRLEEPLQVIFEWRANDRGVRADGRGVARVEPPDRARLDLFLANGETVLRAALVAGEVRMPPGAPDDFLPPPDLMWGALGVVRPGPEARLAGGDRLEGGAVRLRYAYPNGTELHYQTRDGVLTRVELLERGRVVEEVALSFSDSGRYPTGATYRHHTDFRELQLTRESVEAVEPFPEAIWHPTG
ncbi:MAG: hypothetical protein U5R14_07915 [Gemmatimonadota bacterium]|nr:hypothetical protein [Gemmatimonadota bacterium]